MLNQRIYLVCTMYIVQHFQLNSRAICYFELQILELIYAKSKMGVRGLRTFLERENQTYFININHEIKKCKR